MNTFSTWIKNHREFCNYFVISCSLTIFDVIFSRFCERFVGVVEANTISLILGFVIQYFLCAKTVYRSNNARTAIIFFLTWLLALALADSIVYVFRVIVFENRQELLYFLIAKGFSIVIPFFFIYFLRKRLIGNGNGKVKVKGLVNEHE